MALTDTRYRFVLSIYDNEKVIGQEVAFLPALQPDDTRQGFEFTHSQLYQDGEDTTLLVAKVTVERRVID